MKLVWGKISNSIAMAVMPRAELTPEEETEGKGKVLVDLSRSKSGACIYPLSGLAGHDYHAPRWAADGTAPSNSTDPSATAQTYMDRVKADVEAQGVVITEVEVKEVLLPEPPTSPYAGGEEKSDMAGVDWKTYGVDPAPEGEEKDDEGEVD